MFAFLPFAQFPGRFCDALHDFSYTHGPIVTLANDAEDPSVDCRWYRSCCSSQLVRLWLAPARMGFEKFFSFFPHHTKQTHHRWAQCLLIVWIVVRMIVVIGNESPFDIQMCGNHCKNTLSHITGNEMVEQQIKKNFKTN